MKKGERVFVSARDEELAARAMYRCRRNLKLNSGIPLVVALIGSCDI
jgi:hypothetical protein